jgi:RNA recognition motif-containing protein
VNIFVGDLAFTAIDQDLRQLFEPYGAVDKINIITDRYTGHSKGFGFVDMPDSRAAQSAMQGLQGRELAGRALNVDKAKPRAPSRERNQSRW